VSDTALGADGNLCAMPMIQHGSHPIPGWAMQRARQFYERVYSEDAATHGRFAAALGRVKAWVKENGTTPRLYVMLQASAQWNSIDGFARFWSEAPVDLGDHSWRAIHVRLQAASQHLERWESGSREPAISVATFGAWFRPAKFINGEVREAKLETNSFVRCSISCHALGRLIERMGGKHPTDYRIKHLMQPLAELINVWDYADIDGELAIPDPQGVGAWVGQVLRNDEGQLCAGVRTFRLRE
jgi:hypothetical protein